MNAQPFDYIIVGAGAAGCVLAYRLSEDPAVSVALVEAGGRDLHPFFHVPKAIGQLATKADALWNYAVEPEIGNGNKVEYWRRGRVLGGSTSINGLVYVRGQPADFDAIARHSSDDWSWEHIGRAYRALEDHELGDGDGRGRGGPLKISLPGADVRNGLHEAVLAAGRSLGLSVKEDVNRPDNGEGIGYCPRTVYQGWRQSAVTAFLKPTHKRPNLSVITHATVEKIVFEGSRAVGISYRREGKVAQLHARREVIVAAGALASPGILERSGIGDPARLASLGIPVVHANRSVGEGLLEHRALLMQWKMTADAPSWNAAHRGWRLVGNVLRYLLTRRGPIGSATFDIGAWLKSRPELDRPDVQFLIAPHSVDFSRRGKTTEPFPGMSLVVYMLRPSSSGSVHITSTDPEVLPRIIPNHRATSEDRNAMVAGVRAVRRLMAQQPLSGLIEAETVPGPRFDTDEEILKAYDTFGTCGYHAVGSCRMGADVASVIDPELRVRGVEGLRIMDTSVVPIIPSGNTQGPMMAMAWRAADVILRSRAMPETRIPVTAEAA
jgi:choline dehydrogenase-like flavoprotein